MTSSKRQGDARKLDEVLASMERSFDGKDDASDPSPTKPTKTRVKPIQVREPDLISSSEPAALLSPAQKRQLEKKRALRNSRNRNQPSIMPGPLARTNAFSPKKRDLIASSYLRTCVVNGYSVLELLGPELGTQHRDVLYALFRVKPTVHVITSQQYGGETVIDGTQISTPVDHRIMQASISVRDLLKYMQLTVHRNNLRNALDALEQIKAVSMRVYMLPYAEYRRRVDAGETVPSAGFSENIISRIDWSGNTLDDIITVTYGGYFRDMFAKKHLVSMDADPYYKLKSDYAKCLWPYLDSMRSYEDAHEDILASLCGRDLASETSAQKRKFRERMRQAFDDMVSAGGLAEWNEINFAKRGARRRYSFRIARPLANPNENTDQHELFLEGGSPSKNGPGGDFT